MGDMVKKYFYLVFFLFHFAQHLCTLHFRYSLIVEKICMSTILPDVESEVWVTLGGQTVHWIGAQFCFCVFLDSRDKSLNMLNVCGNNQREGKNKRRTKEASLSRNSLTMHKLHSLAS